MFRELHLGRGEFRRFHRLLEDAGRGLLLALRRGVVLVLLNLLVDDTLPSRRDWGSVRKRTSVPITLINLCEGHYSANTPGLGLEVIGVPCLVGVFVGWGIPFGSGIFAMVKYLGHGVPNVMADGFRRLDRFTNAPDGGADADNEEKDAGVNHIK